jgi:hypothetical protein
MMEDIEIAKPNAAMMSMSLLVKGVRQPSVLFPQTHASLVPGGGCASRARDTRSTNPYEAYRARNADDIYPPFSDPAGH